MPRVPRAEILGRLREKVQRRQPIVGGGAGTGLSAKGEEAGGIDLIVIYTSGRYRMAGRGSLAGLLAYGNANEIVVDMGKEVLTAVESVPVLAGVNGTDPFYDPDRFLRGLADQGFSGVQNFPTVGLIDGTFRANLEETGMSYRLEGDMIRRAPDLDLLTSPYVFSAEDAGGTAKTRDDCVELANEWSRAARSVREDVLVLVHGGPVAEPKDAGYVLSRAEGLHGFYGASSMERLPVERALIEQTRAFTELTY